MPLFTESLLSVSKVLMVAVLCSRDFMACSALPKTCLPCSLSKPLALRISTVVCSRAALACLLTCISCCITTLISPRWSAMAPVVCCRFSRVLLRRSTFSRENMWLALCSSRLMLVIRSLLLFSRRAMGDGEAMICGRLPSLPLSSGLCGVPPLSWMIEVPVMPVRASFAWVSSLTGVCPARRIRARTRRGSLGSRLRLMTSPTLIPLYCTELPWDKPLTASLKITS